MSNVLRGIFSGLIFGALAVVTMLPMDFADKNAALTAAFFNRFAIGLVIGCIQLKLPGWAIGLLFGVLLSLPEAIITGAYLPIIGIGAFGGLLIGAIIHGK